VRRSTGNPFTEILKRHINSPLGDEPLTDYLRTTFGRDIELPQLLTTEFGAIAKRLAVQLFRGAA